MSESYEEWHKRMMESDWPICGGWTYRAIHSLSLQAAERKERRRAAVKRFFGAFLFWRKRS